MILDAIEYFLLELQIASAGMCWSESHMKQIEDRHANNTPEYGLTYPSGQMICVHTKLLLYGLSYAILLISFTVKLSTAPSVAAK